MCQVVMGSNAEELVIKGCKEAPLCSSSSLPNSSPHDLTHNINEDDLNTHNHTHSINEDDLTTHDHTHNTNEDDSTSLQNIPFNLITSPHLQENEGCTPGSPEFFLPANAYIALDDPSSLTTSYSSPSDTCNTIWPNSFSSPASALLDCPSLFSSGGGSTHHEATIYCDQIPDLISKATSQFYGTVAAADNSNNSAVLPDPLLMRHLQSALYGQHSTTLNGLHYMMQGSDHPYYSGTNPFGTAYSSSDYSLHHNPTRAPIVDFAMANRALYPHNVVLDGRLTMLNPGIATSNEQEQSWYNFLQQDQEDHAASHPENEAISGSRSSSNMVMAPDHHHHQFVHGIHMPHSCMPMIDHHHHHSMGNPNARSPTHQQVHLTGFQDRSEIADTTFSCTIKRSNKRQTPVRLL